MNQKFIKIQSSMTDSNDKSQTEQGIHCYAVKSLEFMVAV